MKSSAKVKFALALTLCVLSIICTSSNKLCHLTVKLYALAGSETTVNIGKTWYTFNAFATVC